MKKAIATVLLAGVTLTFSGCSGGYLDGGTMLRPPRPTGEKAEIQSIIESKAGPGFKLKYPQNGEYRSAVIMHDLDGSDKEEAIALYSSGNDDTKLHLMVISEKDGEWKSSGDFTVSATGADRVIFADINGDGIDDLLVGWSAVAGAEKLLTAYTFDKNNELREMTVDSTYSNVAVADFDNDKTSELILFSVPKDDAQPNAQLFDYSEKEMRPISVSSVNVDPEVIKSTSIDVGYMDKDTLAVFVDGEKRSGSLVTEVIYWDKKNKTLVNPLYAVDKNNAQVVNPTTRFTTTISKDINRDGIYEIPTVASMPGSVDENPVSVCSMTTWNIFDREKQSLKGVLNTVINYSDGYYFVIPEKWTGRVTARIDTDKRTITFYEWVAEKANSNIGTVGSKLLTINVFSQKEWENGDISSDFEEIARGRNSVYSKASEKIDDELVLTKEEIQDCLYLIS